MEQIKMDLVTGEKVRCSECDGWTEEQCVWMYIDKDGYVYRLLCEECHEKEEKEVSG